MLSRKAASKGRDASSLLRELENSGVVVMARSKKTLGEEMSEAYKDVADVVGVMARAGITRLVARLEPLGVIKG